MKKKRRNKRASTMGPSPPPPSPPPKKSKWGIVWRIITGIILLMGAYWTATQIKNYHKSPEQKYEEATITPGDLKPPKFNPSANTWFYTLEKKPVFTTYPSSNKKLPAVKGILLKDTDSSTIVAFSVGVSVAIVPLKLLYQGIVLNVLSRGNCDTVKLIFGVKDDRLYTSCEFKNLATEETAGIIEFNHWRLFKEHYLYCSNDDSTLEVRDNQNYVNFSLKYELGNKNFNQVFIGGYFIKPTSISVFTNFWKGAARVQDTCYNKLDKSWKQKAEINISALVSVYE